MSPRHHLVIHPGGQPPGNPEKGNRGKIVLFAGLSLGLIVVVVAGLTVFRSALIPDALPSSSTSGDRSDGRSGGSTYMAYVNSKYGDPITAHRPELFEHEGKQYVKLPVTITPVDTGDPAYGYMGMQLFIWALRAAGIDPQTYPYSGSGASGSGYDITYYIDPNTTLPAYSFLRETSVLDDQGKPKETPEDLPIRRVQYEWPNQWNPFSPDNPDDLKPDPLTWDRSIQ